MPFEIAEAGVGAVEMQRHVADGAVALFGDLNFGDVTDFFAAPLPALMARVELFVAFVLATGRFAAGVIIFFALNEHHHVGVLLDGA